MSSTIITDQQPHTSKPVRYHYDRAQRSFHWIMAGLVILAIGLGVCAAFLPPGTSPRRELLEIHKSLGMTALMLVIARFGYRLMVGEPSYRNPLSKLTHTAARGAHLGLYALMLVMPVTGYIFSGAGGYSLPWFGLFAWPRVLPLDKSLAHLGQGLHYWSAWAIGAVLAAHIAAVGWHQWVKRDEVLSRMSRGA